MILVYIHKINPRVNYIFRHIFNNVLQISVKFTTKIEEFIAFDGAKFSYAPQSLANEFHISSHDLLFQKGIKENEVKFGFWDEEAIFFEVPNSTIPFDIFAASFYLLSRYEEYLPFQLDAHGRYNYKNSILTQHSLLNKPIIEIWADKLKTNLQARFPDLIFPERKFHFEPLVDVSMATLFKHKNFLRFLFGGFDDLIHLKFRRFVLRHQVYFFSKKDPYDTFDRILQIKKKYKHPLTFFHLVSKYTVFDHNISIDKDAYRKEIKFLADYTNIGLLTSYYAMDDEKMIERQINTLEQIIYKPVQKVRTHFNRLKIPKTYQLYHDLEIKNDFSMGYNHKIGFRAGTSIPFYFYDIEDETETILRLHPVAISDIILKYQYKLPVQKAVEIMIEEGERIKQYGGHFYPAFHNFILSDIDDWKAWNTLYIETIKHFTNAKI